MGETAYITIAFVTGFTLILIILMIASYCKRRTTVLNVLPRTTVDLPYTRVSFDSDSEDYDQEVYSKDSLLFSHYPNHNATRIE